eukprot:4598507-Amphidinium_carterae.1
MSCILPVLFHGSTQIHCGHLTLAKNEAKEIHIEICVQHLLGGMGKRAKVYGGDENIWDAQVGETEWEWGHVVQEDIEEEEGLDYDEMPAKEAQQELVNFLTSHYVAGKLTAKQTCCIAWFAHKAGLEDMKHLALRPDSASGHFARKLKSVVEREKKEFGNTYNVQVPAYVRHSGGRDIMELPMLCAHEVLYHQVQGRDLEQEIGGWETTAPASYWAHPIKDEESDVPTLAYALFLDGVQYTHNDSLVAITLTNLVHDTKVLLGVVRKRVLCGHKTNCPCGSWCTMYPIFCFLHWTVSALAAGRFPSQRHSVQLLSPEKCHDGWYAGDGEERIAMAGEPLGFKGLCLQIRGDLMELCSGLGFTQWSANFNQCLLCKQNKREWFNGLGDRGCPRGVKRDSSYAEEIGASQVVVDPMTEDVWSLILSVLVSDKKLGGRVLSMALPGQGLMKNDRLEQTPWSLDIWSDIMPAKAIFWRTAMPPLNAKHHNPLLDAALGTTL